LRIEPAKIVQDTIRANGLVQKNYLFATRHQPDRPWRVLLGALGAFVSRQTAHKSNYLEQKGQLRSFVAIKTKVATW
jgi:hypothetical protein